MNNQTLDLSKFVGKYFMIKPNGVSDWLSGVRFFDKLVMSWMLHYTVYKDGGFCADYDMTTADLTLLINQNRFKLVEEEEEVII